MVEKQESISSLIKKGNKSSGSAALGNTFIALIKGIAFALTGNGSMFATMMHSIADAVNQMFVFIGSVLAEKRPTRRFPDGFGRVINLFCMVAVIVVTIMAYETVLEGYHLLKHPVEDSNGYWINLVVLVLSLVIDCVVWSKAMKEVLHDSRVEAKGVHIVSVSFKNVKRAAPPTRLVFYEDLVATSGGLLALIAVLVTAFTNFKLLDGISSIIIGFMMVAVAFRVGYDNMMGLIGVAAPPEIEDKVSKVIFSEPQVTDIYSLRILQEGRYYHVEGLLELKAGMTLADADDIKFRIRDKLLSDHHISDVTLGIMEEDSVRNWMPQQDMK